MYIPECWNAGSVIWLALMTNIGVVNVAQFSLVPRLSVGVAKTPHFSHTHREPGYEARLNYDFG